jgi:hypothetical protein
MKIIKLSIIFLFLFGCGYTPIYQSKQSINFKLAKINYEGDTKINKEIQKKIEYFKNNESNNIYDLNLLSTKQNKILTKNEKGDASSFRLRVDVDIVLSSIDGNKIITKNFNIEETYNSMENKFDLSQYRTNLEKSILSQIVQEITIFLSLIEE